jgi:uncharacterized protein
VSPRDLPPYTHIPGETPHPLRDPAGHSYREPEAADACTAPPLPAPLTWADLPAHPEFQWAVQLFNGGYYWESHEAWESLWHAAGRSGDIADFLKGLIKLAAAGVKLREHNVAGVERHALRAGALFREVQRGVTSGEASCAERSLPELIEIAAELVNDPPSLPEDRTGRPVEVLPHLVFPVA